MNADSPFGSFLHSRPCPIQSAWNRPARQFESEKFKPHHHSGGCEGVLTLSFGPKPTLPLSEQLDSCAAIPPGKDFFGLCISVTNDKARFCSELCAMGREFWSETGLARSVETPSSWLNFELAQTRLVSLEMYF